MRTKLIMIILSLLMAINLSGATPPDRILTLENFIQQAVRNHPAVQKLLFEYREKESLLKQSKALKDFILSATTGYTYSGALKQDGVLKGEKSNTLGISATLAKKFPGLLGMTASISAGYTGLSGHDYNSAENVKEYQPTLGVTLALPLLKNFLGILDRNTLKNMETAQEILEYSRQEALEAWLAQLYDLYHEWALLSRKMELYMGIKERAALLLSQTQRKQAYRIADVSDLLLARENYLKYQALYLGAQKEEEKQYMVILSYLKGKSGNGEKESGDPRYKPEWQLEKLASIELSSVKPANLRIMNLARLQLKYSRRELESAENDLKPSLDLNLKVNRSGEGTSPGTSFQYFNQDEFYVGFQLTMPLENTDKKEARQASKAALQKVSKEYEALELEVATELKRAQTELNRQKDILTLTQERVKLSAYRVELINKRYQQSRVSLDKVAETRDVYANNVMGYLEEARAYQQKLLEYQGLIDKLDMKVFSLSK